MRQKSDLLCLLVNGKGLTDSPTPEYVHHDEDDGVDNDDDAVVDCPTQLIFMILQLYWSVVFHDKYRSAEPVQKINV